MSRIVTDVGLPRSHSTPWSSRGSRHLRRVFGPALAIVTVCSCTVLPLARLAAADPVANDKARAAQIEAEVNSSAARISALGQQYDLAKAKVAQVEAQITDTQQAIDADSHQVSGDRTTLRRAAVENYVTNGQSLDQNPLFSSNQKALADSQEYTNIAEGDVSTAVDNLNTAENQLNYKKSQLQNEHQQVAAQEQTASNALSQAQQQQAQEQQALAQATAQEKTDIAAEQAAAAAAAQKVAEAKIAAAQAAQARAQAAAAAAASAASNSGGNSGGGGGQSDPPPAYVPPPPSAGGAGAAAVAAAESQIGVPYVWGGETPGVGFDCSGLTAWAWGQAGVSLPHYSGAQMADSTPVPIADLQPGDLLFYGPGGSQHVAMYIGGGSMIEAPYTGASVWITGLRLGGDFAGAGRP